MTVLRFACHARLLIAGDWKRHTSIPGGIGICKHSRKNRCPGIIGAVVCISELELVMGGPVGLFGRVDYSGIHDIGSLRLKFNP